MLSDAIAFSVNIYPIQPQSGWEQRDLVRSGEKQAIAKKSI
jgi:hypothetical protein